VPAGGARSGRGSKSGPTRRPRCRGGGASRTGPRWPDRSAHPRSRGSGDGSDTRRPGVRSPARRSRRRGSRARSGVPRCTGAIPGRHPPAARGRQDGRDRAGVAGQHPGQGGADVGPVKPARNMWPILVILTLLRFSARLFGVSPPKGQDHQADPPPHRAPARRCLDRRPSADAERSRSPLAALFDLTADGSERRQIMAVTRRGVSGPRWPPPASRTPHRPASPASPACSADR